MLKLRFPEKLKKLAGKDKKAMVNLLTLFCAGVLLLVLSLTLFKPHSSAPSATSGAGTNTAVNASNQNGAGSSGNGTVAENTNYPDPAAYEAALEQKLSAALSLVDGAGKVQVLVSLTSGWEAVLASDSSTTSNSVNQTDAQGGTSATLNQSSDLKTVMVQNSDGTQTPYVLKQIAPAVSGVLILTEGGGDKAIKDALALAAQALLDVPAYKVTVLKMK